MTERLQAKSMAPGDARTSLWDRMEETLRLIRRYRDTPMSFANACLVRMAELENRATVLTTDSDFRIYRKNSRQVIPTLMPE